MSLSRLPSHASGKNRLPFSLNPTLEHKLLGYATAASAAGVGLMALAQPSLAEVVYTPTHQKIGSVALDLNNDGTTDFTIRNFGGSCFGRSMFICSQTLSVIPNSGNAVLGTYGAQNYAQALSTGKRVGNGEQFKAASFLRMEHCVATPTSFFVSGSWGYARSRYLALKFSIGGETHYGWARITVLVNGSRNGTRCQSLALLTGYAYQTVPGEPLLTGRISGGDEVSAAERPEATLGALALGSEGVVARRREEDAH
ncbi:MAG: hypothetical protein WCA49_24010 [Candidatus Sulfotelmatobacter sp.]